MISHGVEISIAGDGADEKDEPRVNPTPPLYPPCDSVLFYNHLVNSIRLAYSKV